MILKIGRTPAAGSGGAGGQERHTQVRNVRICRTVHKYRPDDDIMDTIHRCGMSESVELSTNIDTLMMAWMPYTGAECQDL